MTKIKFFLIVFSSIFSLYVNAIPAYPGLIRYRCSDGSFVNIRLKGDESNKWATTEDGYLLVRDNHGEWCYATRQKNKVEPSMWRLSAVRPPQLLDALKHAPSEKDLLIDQETTSCQQKRISFKSARAPQAAVTGKQKTLVILMQFKDLYFTKTQKEYNALFNQLNYKEDGARGSVKDFYLENSNGKLDLTCDVVGPFTAKHNMAYYGKNVGNQDTRPEELFYEALDSIKGKVNLKDYDSDKDGLLNNVHIIFAGYGEEAGASANAIWSHEATFFFPIEISGMQLSGYSCAPELRSNRGGGISRIGVHCHEMGHSFGAMDFYDTDYDVNGGFSGTGDWDLMASGSWNEDGISPAHFNPYVKYTMGWVECETLKESSPEKVLQPLISGNKIYRIDTEVEGDYFLIENRQRTGFDSATPGEGLMIYHILPQMDKLSNSNKINASFPQTCYPVCAGSKSREPNKKPSSYGYINSAQCPFPGSTSATAFNAMSTPAAVSATGLPAAVGISAIRQEENGDIHFKVTSAKEDESKRKLLLSDSFEDKNSCWTIEQINGENQWKLFTSNTANKLPPAFDGNSYYALLNTQSHSSESSVSRLISGTITNASPKERYMEFGYAYSTFSTSGNNLKILYKVEGSNDWQEVKSLSPTTQSWEFTRIDLPDGDTDFQIAFEGIIDAGIYFIDYVKIYCKNEIPTAVSQPVITQYKPVFHGMKGEVCIEGTEGSSLFIYSISGRLVYSGTLNASRTTVPLRPGIYIGICGERKEKFSIQ